MLSDELVTFLEEGLDVQLATRDDALRPSGVRVSAVRVEPGGEHVEAFIPKVGAAATLANLRSNGQAAMMCSRASDSRTYQLKGLLVSTRAAAAAERAFVSAQWRKFQEDIGQIGFPLVATATWKTWPSVVIRLRVTSVFVQTPGPGAGAALS